jgi:hypothetical protein
MDTAVNKVIGYEPDEKGAIPIPTDILFLPQRSQWISVQRSLSNYYIATNSPWGETAEA